jgi:diguanylate cyclase
MQNQRPSGQRAPIVITDMGSLEQERRQFADQRRLAYIVVGIIGTLLLIYDMYNVVAINSTHRALHIGNDMVFACIVVVCVYLGYTRRVSIERLERVVFWLLALESLIFNSIAPWILRPTVERLLIETVADDAWLLVLVCAMALQIFSQRRGVLWTLLLYTVSLALIGSYLIVAVDAGGSAALASVIAQAYAVGGMLICFLYVLSRYRDHVQRISLHTELLEQLAYIDPLTALPNRRRMDALIQAQIDLADRDGTPFCVALIDIDHFKQVNDTLGHLAGDLALARVASLAQSSLRTTDLIGRWGGEEFLLLLPQSGIVEGTAAVERVRDAVGSRAGVDGVAITVSCGVTSYAPGDTTTTLIHRADDALYRAKEGGRDRVVTSAPATALLEPAPEPVEASVAQR